MAPWRPPSCAVAGRGLRQLLRAVLRAAPVQRPSSGFGIDKPGGTPCPNLADDDRCRIHATLREDGWSGCATFDCFGAGQQVSQVTYGGVSWREHDNLGEMAAVLSVMRLLHEMLAHLAEVERRSPDPAAAEPGGRDRRH